MKNTENYILLFDGLCNLCNGVVQFVIKREKKAKFKFAALQSEQGKTVLKKFGLPTGSFETFVLIKGEKFFTKSSAALYVLKELGGIWRIFFLFIILPKPLRDFFYTLIAKNRYRIFGKRESCMLPTAELKRRFLE